MTQSKLKPVAVSVRTAGHLSGLGRTRLYELINEGRIASVSVGRRRLISLASLEELLTPHDRKTNEVAGSGVKHHDM